LIIRFSRVASSALDNPSITFLVKDSERGYPAYREVPAPNKKPILLKPVFKLGIKSFILIVILFHFNLLVITD